MSYTALVKCVNCGAGGCQAYAIHLQYILWLMELVLSMLLSHDQMPQLATDQGFVQIQD